MRKLVIFGASVLIVLVLAFAALLVGTGPQDAPVQDVVVELPDTYER